MELVKKIGQKIFFIASAGLMFLLPFNGKLFAFFDGENTQTLLPLFIVIMLGFGFVTEKFTLKKLWDNWAFKGFSLLFLAYLFSAGFIAQFNGSMDELTKKLSLLVVPFILLTNRFFFVKYKYSLFLIYFTGVALTLLFLDVQALLFFKSQGFLPFYINYSLFTHPTYFGSNVLISIIFLFGRIVKVKGSWVKKTLQMILLLILVVHLVFLLSKAVLISALIVLIFFFFYLLFKDVKKMILYVAVFVFPLLLVALMPVSYSKIKDSVVSRFSSLEHYNVSGSATAFRYKISRNAPEIIGSNWLFGVGVGNEQSHLMKFYKSHGWSYAFEGAFNTHNQFVQTCLSVGLFGLLILLAIILVPLFVNEFDGNKIMLLCFVFIFCTEAMLERQAGIVLFVFFYMFSFTLQGSREMKKKVEKG
ncbi:MAG: O-antigen ligase [Saprospiraceae bacterium]